MAKTIIVHAPCGSNSVSAEDFLEADGSGNVKAYDGTGDVLGIAMTNKDSSNNVGCIKHGLVRLTSVAASYKFGDKVEWATGQKVQAFAVGTLVGRAVETKTTTSTDNQLQVYVDFA